MSNRIIKLNQLIKQEISKLIFREIEFQRGVLVTVTSVDTSVDIQYAKIRISVIPQDKEEEVLRILNKEIYQFQDSLNKKLVLRHVPKISFEIDQSCEKRERIENLLKKIEKGVDE